MPSRVVWAFLSRLEMKAIGSYFLIQLLLERHADTQGAASRRRGTLVDSIFFDSHQQSACHSRATETHGAELQDTKHACTRESINNQRQHDRHFGLVFMFKNLVTPSLCLHLMICLITRSLMAKLNS